MTENPQRLYAVTGAAGFLGSQMVWHLLKEGKGVLATDMKEPWWLDQYQQQYGGALRFEPADLNDKNSLEKAIKNTRYLFHFAALFNHSADPELLMNVNAAGTKNVMSSALFNGVERIIHIGSMSVYGHNQVAEEGSNYAITEQKKPEPADPYARSKQASREIAAFFNGASGLEVAIVDPAGIFGPYSNYGNVELIDMLLKGAMLLPDGGKHKASMVHSQDVVGICDYLMHRQTLPKGNDAQEISYLASDTTPLTGRELLEMLWQEIPEELQKSALKAITQRIPLKRWLVQPIAKISKQYQIMYGFGDHSASPEKILNLGYELQFPYTEQTVKDVMDWHKKEGIIAKREK
ncbi:NAD-dependent epimerase/dehydratase family protein [Candidatus Woesearchaeota archaeon]|nr:NAD-dependent epimerase/dehydratase family protein [Candidatus Woesearchaeota archaeon]MBI2582271.1 NAD-dependent epimerase/dehydratase family protein [Candidatus Woesearchaeota archaeon]